MAAPSSYGEAIDRGDRAALAAALARNIRPDDASWPQAGELADYALAAHRGLAAQPSSDLVSGRVEFPCALPDRRMIRRSPTLDRIRWQDERSNLSKVSAASPVSFEANVARLPHKGMPVVIEADAAQRAALAADHGLRLGRIVARRAAGRAMEAQRREGLGRRSRPTSRSNAW